MKKKIVPLLAAIGALFATLSACSSSSNKDSDQTTTVRIGYMESVNSVGLAAIAKEAGYFEAQGLTVKLVKFDDGPSVVAALKSDSIDVGEIGPGAHTQVANGTAKLALFDGLSTSDKLIANKASGITSVSDLKGKKVAVVAGTTSQAILDAALKKAGMTEKDVTVVSMSIGAITTAMNSGKVDACATWAPGTTQITTKLGKNAVTLATDSDFTSSMPFACSWVVTPTFAKKHATTVVKFDKAMFKAMDYRNRGGKNAAKWIATVLTENEAEIKTEITSTEKLYSSKQVLKMLNNGELAKIYRQQQKNLIALGILEDTGDLTNPNDALLTQLINKAA
ncbi:ABC transporter substrate-binding protein [Lacticaseibacillus kribbianus]|uniref:ABC transporter substrate-binding protein n=1 Tax=Lacticaseibacillus kribbianus TaxID=2926292 RepID=UPI001CD432CB|nr:ABC transporter substrate-binding protein [Lacticaseibacillus kribbianus]